MWAPTNGERRTCVSQGQRGRGAAMVLRQRAEGPRLGALIGWRMKQGSVSERVRNAVVGARMVVGGWVGGDRAGGPLVGRRPARKLG